MIVSTLGVALYGLALAAALNTFGDVARYVRAKPPNIAARRAIRERGLVLLRAISDSGQYDRIVVVAHSLGSIVAYDLLRFFWSERDSPRTMLAGTLCMAPVWQRGTQLKRSGQRLAQQPAAREAYRQTQQAVMWHLCAIALSARAGKRWQVGG